MIEKLVDRMRFAWIFEIDGCPIHEQVVVVCRHAVSLTILSCQA